MRWTFTRLDDRASPPSVTLASGDDTGDYRVTDPSLWFGSFEPRGAGGIDLSGRHGRAVQLPRAPGAQIKSLPVLIQGADPADVWAEYRTLLAAVGVSTHRRGSVQVQVEIGSDTIVGDCQVLAPQPQLLSPRWLRVMLEVELVDGVLFDATEDATVFDTYTSGAQVLTITNGGDVEDVWATIEIALASGETDDVERVRVQNNDWLDRVTGNPVGFTVYASKAAADDDAGGDGEQDPAVIDVPLQGVEIDSGKLTVVDSSGDPQTGLLVRRGWHPHWLPLHPGANEIRVSYYQPGGVPEVTIRRKDPYA